MLHRLNNYNDIVDIYFEKGMVNNYNILKYKKRPYKQWN